MSEIRSPRRGRAASFVPLFLAVFGPVLAAQEAVIRPYPAPPSLCAQFDVHAATLQHVDLLGARDSVSVDVEFAGATRRLDLFEFDVRSPSFQLLVADDNGIHPAPRPANVTWRGTVWQDPGSWVAATIYKGSLKALVHLSNGDEYGIQPVTDADKTAGPALHIVYRTADNTALPWTCATPGQLTAPVPEPVGVDVSYVCEIACDADFQFYQLNGSSTVNTQNDVTGIINAVTNIYQNDVQLSYSITTILVRTSSGSNPYTSSVANTLLGQFQSEWNGNQNAIHRDVAHLFTGRNMGQASGGAIGIAFLSSICGSAGYGVSQSRFSNNFSRRTAVTAHELGHNFSAQHCNAVNPCYIMCSGLGGCNGVITTFSPSARNQITSFMQVANCLQILPDQPVISSVAPSTFSNFTPGTLVITGTGMLGANQVNVGGQLIGTGLVPQSNTTLLWNPPSGLAIGNTAIQVLNSAGTSNAFPVTVQEQHPIGMFVNGGVLGGSNLTWTFGGGPGNGYLVVISVVNSTSLFQGWPIVDNPLVLAFGGLDASTGMGTYSVPVPPFSLSGLTIYSQVVEFLPAASLTLDSASVVRATIIVN